MKLVANIYGSYSTKVLGCKCNCGKKNDHPDCISIVHTGPCLFSVVHLVRYCSPRHLNNL